MPRTFDSETIEPGEAVAGADDRRQGPEDDGRPEEARGAGPAVESHVGGSADAGFNRAVARSPLPRIERGRGALWPFERARSARERKTSEGSEWEGKDAYEGSQTGRDERSTLHDGPQTIREGRRADEPRCVSRHGRMAVARP